MAQSRIIDFIFAEKDRLVAYARQLIADEAARDGEDIVQDVALNIFRLADLPLPVENLSAYVYQALRNRAIDYLRRRRNQVSLDDEPGEGKGPSLAEVLSDPALSTEAEINRSEIRRRLYQAIEGLSDDQKAVLIETEFQGRSFKELSRAWNIPLGTLLARKSRAMAGIRLALKDLKS